MNILPLVAFVLGMLIALVGLMTFGVNSHEKRIAESEQTSEEMQHAEPTN